MKLSTKGRYGVRAMLDLALHSREGTPVFLADIAKREEISEKYLEQIITLLNKAGLVKSFRGKKGGYLLAKSAKQIEISEIVQILEGPLSLVNCVSDPTICKRSNLCVTRDVWLTLTNKMKDILSSITLQDLCEMHKRKIEREKSMYYI